MPNTFDPMTEIPDLSGKVIVITGGNAGIGAATTRALAAHNPACIYVCSRSRSRGEASVKSLHEQHPKANVQVLELDLASFDSIRKCAAEFNRISDRLDYLFLNAGLGGSPPGLTVDGFEIVFGVNHLGHSLFTQLLMPKLLKTKEQHESADVRIMVTSSIAGNQHAPKTGLALDAMRSEAPFPPLNRYGHSKLANILFARKLAQEYPMITSTSSHPGLVKSEIWDKPTGAPIVLWVLKPLIWWTGVSIDEGAKTQLWCATARDVENGAYYEPIALKKDGSAFAQDKKLMEELWDWTSNELAEHGAPGWPKV